MTAPWAVQAVGVGDLVNRMKRFDIEAAKALNTEIKTAVEGIRKDAASAFMDTGNPLSNWGSWTSTKSTISEVKKTGKVGGRDLAYSAGTAAGKVKSSMRTVNRGERQAVYGVVQEMDPAGAIFLLAGSRNKSGATFNENLLKKHPAQKWPRILGPAWERGHKQAEELLVAAVDKAVAHVNMG